MLLSLFFSFISAKAKFWATSFWAPSKRAGTYLSSTHLLYLSRGTLHRLFARLVLFFFLGCTFLHLEKRREEEKKGKVERFTQAPLSKNSHLNVRLKRSAATHLVPFRPSAFLSGDNTQHIGTGDEINFCVYPSLFFSRYLLRRSRHRHQTAEHQGSDFATLAGELGHETIKSKTLASWTKA